VSLERNGGTLGGRSHAFSALGAAALALAFGASIAAPAGAIQTDPGAGSAGSAAAPLSTRVIVQWRRGSDHTERVEARADAGVAYAAELGDPNFQLVVSQPGESAAAAAATLEEDPAVAVAEPDGLRSVDAVPDDPRFAEEWGLQNTGQPVNGLTGKSGNDIDVLPAWERTVGTPSTVVADIDSGYRSDSPDLGPVEWTNSAEFNGAPGVDDDGDGKIDDVHGWDFVGENLSTLVQDNNPDDTNLISGGHGVHTAGTIGAAGNNGTGISGVAQNVRIMPLRVCANDPNSAPTANEVRCPNSAIIAAINYAGAKGARVANMSLGGTSFNHTEVNAIAANPGTLYVISAGNDTANNDSGLSGTAGHHYPCDYRPTVDASPAVPGAVDNIICVAALDPSEALASYSDYGAASVDLAAPGTSVLSTFPATETIFSDSFETSDFATKWALYGAGTNFVLAGNGEGPLTSFGITDTPGGSPAASQIYGARLTTPFTVPAGNGACKIEGRRFRKGGTGPYGVIVDGTARPSFNGGETAGSAMVPFNTVPITGLNGHSVALFFEYHASSAPAVGDGLWLDDVALRCNSPLSVPPTYSYLNGTSMAAPHVTGAAALLFSLKPIATVTEVRTALLTAAKPTAALAGKTTTGGRLDVAAAMNALVPLAVTPTPPTSEPLPPETFTKADEKVVQANPPATPAPPTIPATTCTVPKLAGKTLGQAKAALSAAKCKLGKVSSPKVPRGSKPPKLVVKSSTPGAGAKTGGTVAVKLAAKPKGHHH
jgi:subtilisin family serine protease